MISIDNLTVSYGGWTLFDHISFLINPKDRIGLVGKNGAGKTTLLRIITGEQQPTSGAVTLNGDCTIGYLPQTMRVADTTTLVQETAKAFEEVLRLEAEIEDLTRQITERTDYESPAYEQLLHRLNDAQDQYHILGGETRDADIEKTLLGLGFKREDFKQSSAASGGWRMRIELAKLLLRRPSIFLLDEPTNHLDIESIQWLEEYLKNYNGAVLLISHDRAFLDNVTNRTIELSLGKITDYKVPYSKYVVLRAERRGAAAGRLRESAADDREDRGVHREVPLQAHEVEPGAVAHQTARTARAARDRGTRIWRRSTSSSPPARVRDRIVAEINDVGMSFGAKHVFSGANFTIEKGDRIAFVGRNGEGKTTMARILIGQLTPTEGSVRIGANVNIGYYAQNQDDLMDGEFTVYDTLDRVAVGDIRTRLRDILGAFLFRGEDIDKKVKVLSGGERARLAMARMMLEPRNLLVLDEPTNHMDMRSKDILKNAILKYDGTVVVVSHDREFLDGMVQKVYEFRDGGVKEYLGGIYYFLGKAQAGVAAGARAARYTGQGSQGNAEKRRRKLLRQVHPVRVRRQRRQRGQAPRMRNRRPSPARPPTNRRRSRRSCCANCARAVETIETELGDLEKQIAAWDAKFAAATDYNEADYKAYNDLKARYDHQMHEWEKASYELEITEEQYNG